MPQGNGTATAPYDYSKDQDFLRAPIAEQHAYLMENEPDYAKAGQTDQNRYLSHLKEGSQPVAPQPLAERMRTGTMMPYSSGVTPQKEEEYAKNTPMDAQPVPVPLGVAKLPFAAAMRVLGGGAVGAAGGAGIGGYGGGEITGIFSKNPKTRELGRRIGAGLGAIIGGWEGGRRAMPQEAAPVDEVAQAVRARIANWIPTKIKPTPPVDTPGGFGAPFPEAPTEEETLARRIAEGRASRLPTKIKPEARTPGLNEAYEDKAQALMRRGKEMDLVQRMAERDPNAVAKVPIRSTPPSPLTPEQVPGPDTPGRGNMLSPAARRGDPRAGQELMRRGRQVLYVPAEEYPGTRLQGTLEERMGTPAPQPPSPPRAASEVYGPGLTPEPTAYRVNPAMPGGNLRPGELWEGLSEQEAQPPTGKSALADRIEANRGMVEHTPEDLNAAKEARRQKFEKPDAERYKRRPK